MKQGDYNFRLANTIKALRKLRCLTQQEVATILCIERSTYTKLENNEVAITVDELKKISEILKISVFQILVIAEADILIDFKYTSLSEILLHYTNFIQGKDTGSVLSIEQIEYIVRKMKLFYHSKKAQ